MFEKWNVAEQTKKTVEEKIHKENLEEKFIKKIWRKNLVRCHKKENGEKRENKKDFKK